MSISDLMKKVKDKSSKYINDQKLTLQRFEWQKGFGVFSYSQSHVDRVYKYIENQESHHKKIAVRDEYIDMLMRYEVPFEEQFIFEELQ